MGVHPKMESQRWLPSNGCPTMDTQRWILNIQIDISCIKTRWCIWFDFTLIDRMEFLLYIFLCIFLCSQRIWFDFGKDHLLQMLIVLMSILLQTIAIFLSFLCVKFIVLCKTVCPHDECTWIICPLPAVHCLMRSWRLRKSKRRMVRVDNLNCLIRFKALGKNLSSPPVPQPR